jgi:sulfonate transport system permease protein
MRKHSETWLTGHSLSKLGWVITGVLIVVVAWELLAYLIGTPGIFPHIFQIGRAFVFWARSGLFADDLRESLPRVYFAIGVATPIGIAIGLAVGLVAPVRLAFEWFLDFLRSLPPVALLPVFILWFGIDWWSKLAAAVFVCVFPVAVTTAQAATYANQQFSELARDLRMGPVLYVRRIILPASLPAIVPGIRLASGTAFVMLYVSELAGASQGIGYRISISQLAYRADLMLAGLFTLGVIASLTDLAIQRISKRFLHYAGK